MSKFWSPFVKNLVPYVPGEQPKLTKLVKLNTNENPYGPSPKALEAMRGELGENLRLYPDPNSDLLKQAVAELLGDDLFVATLQLPQRLARLRAQFFELGAVLQESYTEDGSSLLQVRIPRVELNRLVSREGLQPLEFIEQHTLQ